MGPKQHAITAVLFMIFFNHFFTNDFKPSNSSRLVILIGPFTSIKGTNLIRSPSCLVVHLIAA
jgi:hypothetical protein